MMMISDESDSDEEWKKWTEDQDGNHYDEDLNWRKTARSIAHRLMACQNPDGGAGECSMCSMSLQAGMEYLECEFCHNKYHDQCVEMYAGCHRRRWDSKRCIACDEAHRRVFLGDKIVPKPPSLVSLYGCPGEGRNSVLYPPRMEEECRRVGARIGGGTWRQE